MTTADRLEAMTEIMRDANAKLDPLLAELESLRRLKKMLEDRVDTVDDSEGQPAPNEAMSILSEWEFNETYPPRKPLRSGTENGN